LHPAVDVVATCFVSRIGHMVTRTTLRLKPLFCHISVFFKVGVFFHTYFFGVLAYNSGNWCRAYESFDAAINAAKTIGMEENPSLKKYRDMAKERF
jgi:hypothetical protein